MTFAIIIGVLYFILLIVGIIVSLNSKSEPAPAVYVVQIPEVGGVEPIIKDDGIPLEQKFDTRTDYSKRPGYMNWKK